MLYQQPQVGPTPLETSHPLAKGLALVVNPGISAFRDALNNRVANRNGTFTGAGPSGIGIKATSNSAVGAQFAGSKMSTSDGVGTGDFTYLVIANPVASSSREFFVCSQSGSAEFYFGANINVGLTATPGAVSAQTNVGGPAGITVASAADGNSHVYVYTRVGSGGNLYVDGGLAGSAPLSAAQMWQSNTSDYIGGYSGAGWGISNGVFLVLGWNRALSATEVKSISANPWQLFLDDEDDYDFTPLAAGGSNGTATSSGIGAVALVGTATASGGAKAAPSGAGVVASPGFVQASGSASGAPLGVGAAAATGTTLVFAAAKVSPIGIGAVVAVGFTTVAAGASASPTGVTATSSVGTAAATGAGAGNANPVGVTASTSVGGVTAIAGARSGPAGVAASGSVGVAAATGGASVSGAASPAGINSAATVGTPAASGGAGASSAGVIVIVSIGQVIASGTIIIGSVARPSGITAYALSGTAVANGGGIINYARAPSGAGFTPQQREQVARPAQVGSVRPANTESSIR